MYENNGNTSQTDDQVAEAPEGHEDSTNASEGENEFSREYVEKLRTENADYRNRAKKADDNLALARQYALKLGSSEFLREPIEWSDDFLGEDGMPDLDAIKQAAEQYSLAHPQAAKVRGDSGSGYRGQESDSFSLLDALRA